MLSSKRAKYSKSETNETDILRLLRRIETYQEEIDTLQDKTCQQILKIEQKLETEKKPIYMKRDEIISQIPNFWLTTLLNHPEVSSLLDDSEEEYLIYLSRIEVQIIENVLAGFKILFHFKENPYFDNSILVKEYFNTKSDKDGKTICQITSVPILWKEGQDISGKLKEKKSFFFWLTSHEFGSNDIDVAQVIKDDLWTNPLHYYLLTDTENDENSDEDDDNDVLIIEDSDDEKKYQDDPEDEESDNDSEEYDSLTSSENENHDN